MQKWPTFVPVSQLTVKKKRDRLRRCIARIVETYEASPDALEQDLDQQDIIILNLQRACEQVIDIAQVALRVSGGRVADTSADALEALAQQDIISIDLATGLKGLVGFRNVVVHEYENIDFGIVRSVITTQLDQLMRFADICMVYVADAG